MAYIGVDIGGTKLAVSLSSDDGVLQKTVKCKTPENDAHFSMASKELISIILEMQSSLAAEDCLRGIGLSCPGPLDKLSGTIIRVATTGWNNVPVQRIFEDAFHVPVLLENDANCAAYAESIAGAGMGYDTVVYFTVSTGIGGGICVGGELLQGEWGQAAELGHICVNSHGDVCDCGGCGCVELYASGTQIARRVRQHLQEGASSSLSNVPLEHVDAISVEKAVRDGDHLAEKVWSEAMHKLGIASAIVAQVVNPGVIVFGGGVSNAWDLMEQGIRISMERYAYPDIAKRTKLAKAKHGETIGTTGAVLLVRKKYPPQDYIKEVYSHLRKD